MIPQRLPFRPLPALMLLGLWSTISCFSATTVAGECQFGCCTMCGRYCRLSVEQVDEKVTCHDIECKEVCIPPIRFPWECCSKPKCGRVRLVAKLKEEKRDTKVCEYNWEPVCANCRQNRCPCPSSTCSPGSLPPLPNGVAPMESPAQAPVPAAPPAAPPEHNPSEYDPPIAPISPLTDGVY